MRDENKNMRQIGRVMPLLCILPLYAPLAGAFQLKFEDPELKGYWDNTLKYSSAFRVSGQDSGLIADPNADDGNRDHCRADIFSL